MKIIVTADEILESGCWEDFCNKHGINEWAINEGLMEPDHKFSLSPEEAKEYGLL